MAEHDYVIANQNGANTRSDLNNALAAIVSNNSKATEPTTTYAFMWWADTANDILKQRNAADSAWISILTLSTGAPLGTLSSSLLSGALPAIDGSALTGSMGKVLQVVQGTTTTQTTNSTTTYADTTLTATITPTSTTSKILVVIHQNGCYVNGTNASNSIGIRLLKDASVISTFAQYAGYTGTTLPQYIGTLSTSYLDSPASTSALVYKTQFKNMVTSALVRVQDYTETSTITLMEIGV